MAPWAWREEAAPSKLLGVGLGLVVVPLVPVTPVGEAAPGVTAVWAKAPVAATRAAATIENFILNVCVKKKEGSIKKSGC